MTLLYMLDTNMVSYVVRGRSIAARTRLAALQNDEVACISAITEAEILYGLARRPDATALRAAIEDFLGRLRILPWGRSEAQSYGQLRAKLEASGTSLGHMDMLIAAHAVSTGAILVTNDKAFTQVDQLHATVNWATDI
ncbi:type II toxin-antitoxin system VapC family toxin [Acidicapsa ligni]|uniref:type II toxin-antitoxin system VapC family toxin n=1 Tax=Acidicapsa ligni TaxID=542300 RepID=UPI0021DF9FB0|nr:type II toxin-antitoxin system VapC family toxin [Acidicapsa ligni]